MCKGTEVNGNAGWVGAGVVIVGGPGWGPGAQRPHFYTGLATLQVIAPGRVPPVEAQTDLK